MLKTSSLFLDSAKSKITNFETYDRQIRDK